MADWGTDTAGSESSWVSKDPMLRSYWDDPESNLTWDGTGSEYALLSYNWDSVGWLYNSPEWSSAILTSQVNWSTDLIGTTSPWVKDTSGSITNWNV